MEVAKVENVTRTFKIGEVETRALRGVDLNHWKRRIHCIGWTIRFGQNHFASITRMPRSANQRKSFNQWKGCHET